MKIFFKTTLISILFLVFFTPLVSFAAEVFVSLPKNTNVNKTFEVSVNVNTDGVSMNSVNIALDYDENLLSFSGYKSDGSIVNLWLNSPHAKDGQVYMDGIIPGGVSGLYDPKKANLSPVPVAVLKFTAKDIGNANFSFIKTEIFKHDGKGTTISHNQRGGSILIKENISENDENIKSVNEAGDTTRPEPFLVTFLNSSTFSRTPSMVIFNAHDAESGIKEYQMNTGGSSWVSTQSPQQVSKGLLSYTVTIRAIDFSGNFQEASVIVPGVVPAGVLWSTIVLLLFFCILIYRVIKYKR